MGWACPPRGVGRSRIYGSVDRDLPGGLLPTGAVDARRKVGGSCDRFVRPWSQLMRGTRMQVRCVTILPGSRKAPRSATIARPVAFTTGNRGSDYLKPGADRNFSTLIVAQAPGL